MAQMNSRLKEVTRSLREGRLRLQRKNKLSEASKPSLDLSIFTDKIGKMDKELQDLYDKKKQDFSLRIKQGDEELEMFVIALKESRELILELMKMADAIEDRG